MRRWEDWSRSRPQRLRDSDASVGNRWVQLKDVQLLTVPALQVFFTPHIFFRFWSDKNPLLSQINESLHLLSSPFFGGCPLNKEPLSPGCQPPRRDEEKMIDTDPTSQESRARIWMSWPRRSLAGLCARSSTCELQGWPEISLRVMKY